MTALHTGYQQSALNCWIAALLYLVTLAIAGHQLWANHQNQEQFKVLSSALSVLCSRLLQLGLFCFNPQSLHFTFYIRHTNFVKNFVEIR